jgi:mono/diheme cytochrome c family protein
MLLSGIVGAFVFGGVYNIGADAPHYTFVYRTLEKFRESAIRHHARDIVVPGDLDKPERIAAGAGLYQEMCTGCHLGPGVEKSEISQGLYPQAPELARGQQRSVAEQFWIIKHGVKLSAMPAWGKTHDDQLIWDMVSFVRQLPRMTPQQYRAAIASAPADHDEMMKDMPGMSGAAAEAGPDKDHPVGHSHDE